VVTPRACSASPRTEAPRECASRQRAGDAARRGQPGLPSTAPSGATPTTLRWLSWSWPALHASTSSRAVVVTGADGSFCAGGELAQLSPRYLEITKVSSNVWWNAARDSFTTGLGMLVQAIGRPDMSEGAQAFLEKRSPQFPAPDA
jgi:enoyl-CoA hydratase/carnithine racemase